MKAIKSLFLSYLCLFISNINAQNTYDMVYDLFQTSCAGYCHSGPSASGGLDLQGSGTDPKSDVWNNLYDATPTNSFASSQGYKRIFPGDPYRSTLFRKINHGMDDFISLDASEGGSMPALELKDREKELIRQWILFNSPQTGNIVDTALIGQYYDGFGVDGIATRPTPPALGEGFQIKLGPFFLYANQETEYYYKYHVKNDDTIEVNEVFSDLGQTYSHHLIIFRFTNGQSSISEGFRDDNAHYNVDMVTAHQQTESVVLPQKTGFQWTPNTVLDLNTHYINYSSSSVLKCENYINIYTQQKNTALHHMQTGLYPNYTILIPNDGNDYTFTKEEFDTSTDNIYVWSMSSHTHQWGRDYDIWHRNPDGSKGTKVYDASNLEGDPNGVTIGYDYQHPPTIRWEYPFLSAPINEGFIHEAKFNNTGSSSVYWGPTSDDEMMIMALMYLEDTTGLANNTQTGIDAKLSPKSSYINLYPNPNNGEFSIETSHLNDLEFIIHDITGKRLFSSKIVNGKKQVFLNSLNSGLYFYEINDNNSSLKKGKLLIH